MSGSASSEPLKYGRDRALKTAETLGFHEPSLGQRNPQHCPQSPNEDTRLSANDDLLGEPLAIEQVADLLGCSAWTVRQRYLKQGLPFLQARPRGKLVFFREQVTAWILKRQRQKGGTLR